MKSNDVLLFGAGDMARRTMLRLVPKGIEPMSVVVSDTSKNPGVFFGIPVISLDEAREKYKDLKIYIGTDLDKAAGIAELLQHSGFTDIEYIDYDRVIYRTLSTDLKMKYIYEWYKAITGKEMDWHRLVTFNEKLQWLKLFDKPEEKGKLADKYSVREYVADKIGDEYLVPLLGVWEDFSSIDFDILPDSFVLKCNHGSGWNSLVYDKSIMDMESEKKKFDAWMDTCFTDVFGLELQYEYIKPKIIAEKMLKNDDNRDIEDYKIFVFHGKAKMIQVDIGRWHEHRRNLYTPEWRLLDSSIQFDNDPNIMIPRPKRLDEMISAAEKLSDDFMHVRVDFYVINEKPYFGEMTFTHGSGRELFMPDDFGAEVGGWLELPTDYDSARFYG